MLEQLFVATKVWMCLEKAGIEQMERSATLLQTPPGSIIAMKGLLVLLDLAAIGFLILALGAMRKSRSLAILYALNPLVIKVFAGSGHVDALLVAALCATGRSDGARRQGDLCRSSWTFAVGVDASR